MNRFRIYALIHGTILPVGKLFDLEIRKMSFEEQGERSFSPIQSVFSEHIVEEHKTYVTSLPYIDPVRIKSDHVVICDIEEDEANGAIGAAIRRFDKLCRYLSIANLQDVREKFGNKLGSLLPYVYQVNKIYLLDTSGDETDVDFKLESGHVYLPDRPEADCWRSENTGNFLKEIYNFHDETLERALKYMYRSSIGHLVSDSPEKIALDHFKSIEIIIKSLSNKREFKDRLEEAGGKIGLTQEEKGEIIKFWDSRSSHGDIAHPAAYDQAERYPNQFPIPSNVSYPWAFLSSAAADICLKYFRYKKNLFLIEIDDPFEYTDNSGKLVSMEGVLSQVNPQWESSRFCFHTSEQNKESLKQKVKKAFAEEYSLEESNLIIEFGATRKNLILRITSTQAVNEIPQTAASL